jgi:uncharacterized protein YbjT (DUF2867 family)
MTVLVIGGSSQIGYFLLPRLIASGEPVLALSRQPRAPQDGVQWLEGALPDAVPPLPTLSAIVSFGPLPALASWLQQTPLADAPRVIATSSMSAQSKRDSAVAAERVISQQVRDGEAALAAACTARGCAWTVLRPTLVYGAGLDKSLTPIARRASSMRLFPLPAGRGLRQPVHADDIAQAVIAALECHEAAGQIVSIGGGERLLAGEMFARVRRSLSTPTLPILLPRWLLRLAGRVLPRARGPLSRLDADLIADNAQLQQLLGVHPRPFQPHGSMWVAPEEIV